WGSFDRLKLKFDRTAGPLTALRAIRWATVVTRIEAERYRQLARDLHFVSKPTARGAPFRVAGNGRGMGPLGRSARARCRFTGWRTPWPMILLCLGRSARRG